MAKTTTKTSTARKAATKTTATKTAKAADAPTFATNNDGSAADHLKHLPAATESDGSRTASMAESTPEPLLANTSEAGKRAGIKVTQADHQARRAISGF